MTRKQLIREAKQEIAMWHGLPPGLVLAILWAFVYRITEGEPIEAFFKGRATQELDYQI